MKSSNNIIVTVSIPSQVVEGEWVREALDLAARFMERSSGAKSPVEFVYEMAPVREPTKEEYEASRKSGAPATGEMVEWIRGRRSVFDVTDVAAGILGLTRQEVEAQYHVEKTLADGKVVRRASSFRTTCNNRLREALEVLELEGIGLERLPRKPQEPQRYAPKPRLDHWST